MFLSNLLQRVCGNNMVPEASRTKQMKYKKEPRLSSWFFFVLALPILPSASACQVSRPEAGLTDLSRDGAGGIPNQAAKRKKNHGFRRGSFMLALPIFPGRLQPSIVGRSELNFRVRDGNGWTLALISTNCADRSCLRSTIYSIWRKSGDPYRIRTDVKGVRGLCLNHLTNGPFGTPSGTRTLDTLIKSQVLYQLS